MPKAKDDEIIYCAFCGGHGRIPPTTGTICPACGGAGKFSAPKWVYCSACSGYGVDRSQRGDRKPCPACGGKGKVCPKEL